MLALGVLLGVTLVGGEPSEAVPTRQRAAQRERARPDAAAIAARRHRALVRLSEQVAGARRLLAVTVVDCGQAPAADAAVTVLGADGVAVALGRTDARGVFATEVPEEGAVTVTAALDDHEGGAPPSSDTEVRLDVCPGASVEGRVVDRRGRPVADATVTLGDGLDVAVTDEAGEFVLTDVDLTGDRVSATAEAASAQLALAPLAPFEVRKVELVLETGRRLLGVVVDPKGDPVPYASLVARDFADSDVARARADRLGRFWLKEVPFTPVPVTADDGQGGVGTLFVDALHGSGSRPEPAAGVLRSPAVTGGQPRRAAGLDRYDDEAASVRDDLVITLQPAGRLTVDYVGSYRGAFQVVVVNVDDGDGGGHQPPTQVATLLGPGDVAVLPAPRKYWVVYGDGADVAYCGEVLLTPGAFATVRCGTARLAHIVGRVVDSVGRALPGVWVAVTAPGVGAERVATDQAGRFSVDVETSRTVSAELVAAVPGAGYLPTRRRNVPLAPGETTDLGDLRLDEAADFPGLASQGPFGGIGAQIETTEDGIKLGRIVKGGPLDAADIEAGEIVVAIGEAASGFLPALDAVRLLRGDPGSKVTLRLRKADGSTREVTVERSVIDVESAGWVN